MGLAKKFRRVYCGPVAIAATMGVSVDAATEAATIVRRKSGSARPVKGMYHGEICDAIRTLGGSAKGVHLSDDAWAVQRLQGELLRVFIQRRIRSGKRFIVATSSHYIAVEEAMILDTTYRRPTWAFDAPELMRRRVVWAVEVTR